MQVGSTLTADAVATLADCCDPRLRTVIESLIRHVHAFVQEVELTPEEWLAGIGFLTATGQKCDDYRQEFMLLSDTLGATALVDEIANGRRAGATEASLLGPFYTEDPPEVGRGESIASAGKGVPLVVHGAVHDAAGAPIADAVMDVWGTDGTGRYDTQYAEHVVDCRGRVRTAADGSFDFRAVVPVSYSVPTDGPVGPLLHVLGRHAFRPAHLHFRITAPGYRPLVTAIYAAGDPYLRSDAVFGVHDSLIEEFRTGTAPDGSPLATLTRDFILGEAR